MLVKPQIWPIYGFYAIKGHDLTGKFKFQVKVITVVAQYLTLNVSLDKSS